MLDYNVIIRGEDGMEFAATVSGDTRDEAYDNAREFFPEGTILEVMSPADIRARDEDLYISAERMYDDPSYDNYDY